MLTITKMIFTMVASVFQVDNMHKPTMCKDPYYHYLVVRKWVSYYHHTDISERCDFKLVARTSKERKTRFSMNLSLMRQMTLKYNSVTTVLYILSIIIIQLPILNLSFVIIFNYQNRLAVIVPQIISNSHTVANTKPSR